MSITTTSIRKGSQVAQLSAWAIASRLVPVCDSWIVTAGRVSSAAIIRNGSMKRAMRSERSSMAVGFDALAVVSYSWASAKGIPRSRATEPIC
jgi:hypothetical protein